MTRKRKTKRLSRQSSRRPHVESLEARQLLAGDVPFDGSAILYQVHGHTSQGQLSTIDVASGSFENIGDPAGFKINASGYRTADNFIYGMKVQTVELLKLDATGSVENLGKIDGLPNRNYYSGDFGPDGLLYLWNSTTLYGVNVDTASVDREVPLSRRMGSTPDIAYDPITELMYGVEKTSSQSRAFVSIDVTDGNVNTINPAFTPSNGTFGAMFADANGRVFAANNRGGLYEVDTASGEPTFVGYSPRASTNDGSSPSTAVMNLPPVAYVDTAYVPVATTGNLLEITTPTDPENNALAISITGLPSHGVVRYADGSVVNVNDTLSTSELVGLQYDAPLSKPTDGVSNLTYDVSDVHATVSGAVELSIGGFSTLEGSVTIDHDTDDDVYSGYAFNNEIRLTGTALDGTVISETVMSDVHGLFRFEELAPGNYTLTQAQPTVVKEGFASAGVLGGDVSENVISNIVIPAGRARVYGGNNFVEMAPSTVSGFVHIDEDFDGQLDGSEAGVRFAEVTLTGTDDLGEEVLLTTETDIFGYYEFTGLRPGLYTVTETQPDGFIDAVTHAGSEEGTVSANQVSDIRLGTGINATHYDFGEFTPNSISGSVFIDNDWDNIFDLGDTPIREVLVSLSGVDALGNEVSATAVTDDNGLYSFENLSPGTYTVTQDEQPVGLVDGRDNIGAFARESGPIERNGVVGEDQFTEIVLTEGDVGRGYDFGERLVFELMDDFDVETKFRGTGGDDVFTFVAGEEFHTVTVNGETTLLDATLRHNVLFIGYGGYDKITITGTDDVETLKLRPTTADYHARDFRVRSFHTEEAIAYNGGGFDRVYMYDSAGNDVYRGTENYVMMRGDGYFNRAFGFHRSYAFSTRGGLDIATMTDSKRDDTFRATSESARLFGRHYYNYTRGFDRVISKAVNGGHDTAVFWDSSADKDIFQATDEYSRMYNTGYYNYASGFDQVRAYANQGGENDRAYLRDSAGDDILVSTPAETGLTTEAHTIKVHDFERMYAYSTEGNDRAYLYDSKLDDVFSARPEDARLYNDDYYLKVNNFGQVDAFSSGGGFDRAYFYDSAGDDTLIALENEVRMYGSDFDNTSHGFSRAYAFARSGGNDRAVLYDTEQADTIRISDGLTRMYGQGYYTRVEGFGHTDAVFSDFSNQDRALIFGGVSESTLKQAGSLAKHIAENSSAYIHNADAIAAMFGEDVENDVFTAPGPEGDSFDLELKDF